jgi:parallel beta helix pectate lyase-like protein
MTAVTPTALRVRTEQIRSATQAAENSAQRVGQVLTDFLDTAFANAAVILDSTATGATNAATLQAALTAVAAGGSVAVSGPGTYDVTSITLTGGRGLLLGAGVTLNWAANTATPMFAVSGRGCFIRGGKLNGNGSNQSSSTVAITLTLAPEFVMERVDITNFKYKFLLTDEGGDLSPDGWIKDCRAHDMGLIIDCDIFGVRSSRWLFQNVRFKDITQAGHCIRFGLYNAGPAAVVDSKVQNCSFNDSVEVGVVCEIYTQGIEIAGCSFRNLLQGVKCESTGSTVSGVTIDDCEFRGLTLSTGFNWTVPGTYCNNRCYDCACGIEITKDAIVRGNYLENCGTSSEGAIHLFSGGSGSFDISGNTIVNPVGSGIVLGTSNALVIGNTIRNVSAAGKYGIDIDKDNQKVNNNVINTVAAGATGMRVVSSCTNSQVTQNTFLNLTGSGLTATNGANFYTCQVKDNLGIAQLALDHNIVAGVFTIGLSSVDVVMNTEGGAATDDLDTMTAATNLPKGHVVVLRDNGSSTDVTVKHNTGNILLAGAADFTLLTSAYHIALMWSGTKWCELWRATA